MSWHVGSDYGQANCSNREMGYPESWECSDRGTGTWGETGDREVRIIKNVPTGTTEDKTNQRVMESLLREPENLNDLSPLRKYQFNFNGNLPEGALLCANDEGGFGGYTTERESHEAQEREHYRDARDHIWNSAIPIITNNRVTLGIEAGLTAINLGLGLQERYEGWAERNPDIERELQFVRDITEKSDTGKEGGGSGCVVM